AASQPTAWSRTWPSPSHRKREGTVSMPQSSDTVRSASRRTVDRRPCSLTKDAVSPSSDCDTATNSVPEPAKSRSSTGRARVHVGQSCFQNTTSAADPEGNDHPSRANEGIAVKLTGPHRVLAVTVVSLLLDPDDPVLSDAQSHSDLMARARLVRAVGWASIQTERALPDPLADLLLERVLDHEGPFATAAERLGPEGVG